MARKRAPGAGRKPQGEFAGKSAAFSTRITPETRRALDEAVRSHRPRISLSQHVEYLLTTAMQKPSGKPRNYALACAIALLAENIERGAETDWRADPFTGQALRYAVETLLFQYAATPEGTPAIPPAIEEAAARMPPEFAERFRTPAGFGHVKAYNLISEIDQVASPATPNEWSLPIFFSEQPVQLAVISRDLVQADRKKGKSK